MLFKNKHMIEQIGTLEQAWVCQVKLAPKSNIDSAYIRQIAVWAASAKRAEEILITHTQGSDEKLSKIINITSADNISDPKKLALSKRVNPFTTIAISQPEAIDQEDLYANNTNDYLTITEHNIAPLPEQKGMPFWEKEWIDPELKKLLFNQPIPGQSLNTFFVVDASLRRKITRFFDLGMLDVPCRCLFTGKASQELEEVAPYLIDIGLADDILNNKDKITSFHRDFFVKHWHHGTGIVLRTTADMDTLHNHLRKFTKIKDEDGKWYFFRFWDPRVFHKILKHFKSKDFCELHKLSYCLTLVDKDKTLQVVFDEKRKQNILNSEMDETASGTSIKYVTPYHGLFVLKPRNSNLVTCMK